MSDHERGGVSGEGHPVPSNLEMIYRGLLRCYPPRWRAARGDEVIGTLLDGAEAAGRSRPTVSEAVDLVVHGLRTRVVVGVGTVPMGVRDAVGTLTLALELPVVSRPGPPARGPRRGAPG